MIITIDIPDDIIESANDYFKPFGWQVKEVAEEALVVTLIEYLASGDGREELKGKLKEYIPRI